MSRAHKPISTFNLITWAITIAICVAGAIWIAG